MTLRIALSDRDTETVSAILRQYLPCGVTVHVFGSRASGHVKPWSDLDLVFEAASPLPLSITAALAEAFEESQLPWNVDIVDRKTVSEPFGRLIDTIKLPFPYTPGEI